MRSVLYRRHGNPSGVLEVAEVLDAPLPLAGQVLVRVLARPVHHGDLLGVAGRYRSGDTSVPEGGNSVGFEGYGMVEAVGTDVELRPGTRVAFFPGRAAWSERAIVQAEHVSVIPDGISDEIAAQLHVNPLTAALLSRAAQRAGTVPGSELVVLTAAGSAVAKLTAAMLRRAGIDAVGIVRSAAGAVELSTVTPHLPVISTDAPDWRDRLAETAAGRAIRTVLDPVAGSLASDLVSILAGGGSLVSYGDLSGEPIVVPALALSTRGISMSGVTVGSWGGLPAEQRAADLRLALTLATENPELFPIAERYDLADVREAAAHVDRPNKAGVVLLTSY